MIEIEREAWIAFKSVVTKFLGEQKETWLSYTVANMLENFKVMGCLMSLKIIFSNLHLDIFSKILVQRVSSKGNVSTGILWKWIEGTGLVEC
jgi:hypothetical protein